MSGSSNNNNDDDEPVLAHDESNWLVSYADMMTLLFGFFVLMYSFSKIDVEKYTVVSKDIAKYFGGKTKEDSGIKILTDDVKKFLETRVSALLNENKKEFSNLSYSSGEQEGNLVELGKSDDLAIVSPGEEGEDGDFNENENINNVLDIKEGLNSLTVKFRGSILFQSGSAQLKTNFEKTLTELGQKLKSSERVKEIKIEGHTDDNPIQSVIFPTNWELSSARSAKVARHFEALGFDPKILIPEGFGSSRPEFPNRDDAGKPIKKNQSQNRRVILHVQFEPNSKSLNKSEQDIYKDYFEKVKKANQEPAIKMQDSGALGEAKTAEDFEKRLQEAKQRLEAAKKRIEEKKKQKELLKKLDQLNKKAEELEKM